MYVQPTKYSYCKTQLMDAARFLVIHNPTANQMGVDQVCDHIKKSMKNECARIADNYFSKVIGTLGYYLIFSQEDKEVMIDILVDPAVGKEMESNWVTKKIKRI